MNSGIVWVAFCGSSRNRVGDFGAGWLTNQPNRDRHRTEHVNVELAMELILGDLFQRKELIYAGIVHQHVERVEGFFGFVEQLPYICGLRNVALYRNGFTALRFDVDDNAVRVLFVGDSISSSIS